MLLLCIDPGTTASGVVILDTETLEVSGVEPEIDNEKLINAFPFMHKPVCGHLAIEAMAGSYGTVVGSSTIQTIIWTGRFIEAFGSSNSSLVYRPEVKTELADSQRANDAAIRQSLIDRYPATGGGARPQIGTKKQPGPLYGVSKHAWPALAVGHTWVAKYSKVSYVLSEHFLTADAS